MDKRIIKKVKMAKEGIYEVSLSGIIEHENQSWNADDNISWDIRVHPDFSLAYKMFNIHAAAIHLHMLRKDDMTIDEFIVQRQDVVSQVAVTEIQFKETIAGHAVSMKYTFKMYDGETLKGTTPFMRLDADMSSYPFTNTLSEDWYKLSEEAMLYSQKKKFSVEASPEEVVPQPELDFDHLDDSTDAAILEDQVMN